MKFLVHARTNNIYLYLPPTTDLFLLCGSESVVLFVRHSFWLASAVVRILRFDLDVTVAPSAYYFGDHDVRPRASFFPSAC